MIDRYSLPEMSNIWTDSYRFNIMLEIEKGVALFQGILGIIPKESSLKIREASLSIDRLRELEYKVKHETNAFIEAISETLPEQDSKWLHYGLTSSDILDSAQAIIIKAAHTLLEEEIEKLLAVIYKISNTYKLTKCVGRTHGQHAEIITFGSKFEKFEEEVIRNKKRLLDSIYQLCKIKLSGPTGNYTTTSSKLEEMVAASLNMGIHYKSTQVAPRDNHAELISALALYGTGLERIALEIRHLSRTEIDEVSEGFGKDQKGSSAMPHKRNPIDSENISGLARMLRSYVQPAMENILLWHERDMSHSSVERIILPDAFILAHYMTVKMTNILSNLGVKPNNMQKNIELTKNQTSSALALMEMIKEPGMTREKAYRMIQSNSFNKEN